MVVMKIVCVLLGVSSSEVGSQVDMPAAEVQLDPMQVVLGKSHGPIKPLMPGTPDSVARPGKSQKDQFNTGDSDLATACHCPCCPPRPRYWEIQRSEPEFWLRPKPVEDSGLSVKPSADGRVCTVERVAEKENKPLLPYWRPGLPCPLPVREYDFESNSARELAGSYCNGSRHHPHRVLT